MDGIERKLRLLRSLRQPMGRFRRRSRLVVDDHEAAAAYPVDAVDASVDLHRPEFDVDLLLLLLEHDIEIRAAPQFDFAPVPQQVPQSPLFPDRKSTRLNSSHGYIS